MFNFEHSNSSRFGNFSDAAVAWCQFSLTHSDENLVEEIKALHSVESAAGCNMGNLPSPNLNHDNVLKPTDKIFVH